VFRGLIPLRFWTSVRATYFPRKGERRIQGGKKVLIPLRKSLERSILLPPSRRRDLSFRGKARDFHPKDRALF